MALRPIYYDTETTGVNSKKDKIIEIAAFDPVLNRTFSQLINPERPIPEESTQICNITDEMVKDCPTFEQVGQKFVDFCKGETVLIAHNNDGFDKFFLIEEFKRANLILPNWPYIDSLKWARKYRPDLPRHALQYLREIYEIEANQAHRALDDVMVLYKIFSKMTDDLSMENIIKLIYKSTTEIDRMPFGKYIGTPLKKVPKWYIEWLDKNNVLDKEEHKNLKLGFEKLNLLASKK